MNNLTTVTGKTMTVKEISNALGVSKDTVLNCIKRTMPELLQHGKTTYLSESELALIKKDLFNNTNVQQQINNNGKFMTIRNVADSLDVSYSAVYRAVCKLFPDKTKNGKLSMLNEIEVSQISRELKTDYHTAQLTFSAGEKVKNTTTNLEILENYKKANDDFVALLNRMYEEEKQKREIAEKSLNRIADGSGCFTINQTAKALKLPYGNITLYKNLKTLNILNVDNSPKQEQVNSGNFKVVVKFINDKIGNKPVTLVTSKGLVYLAKKFNTTIDETVKADYED